MGFHCPKCPNPAHWGPGAGLRGGMGGHECPPRHTDTQTDGQAEPQVRQRCSAPRLQPQLPAIPPRVQHRLRLVGTWGWGHCSPAPPPIPHPRLFSSLSPQLLGAGVRGQPVLLLLPPLSRCLGHFHAGLVFVFFFLEGDFRTSPPKSRCCSLWSCISAWGSRDPSVPHPRGRVWGGRCQGAAMLHVDVLGRVWAFLGPSTLGHAGGGVTHR